MENNNDITSSSWSLDIENVLESIRYNSYIMSNKHKKNYIYYKGQLKYYRIPVIIISGVNSVIAVGLQPYLEQGIISGANCLLALLCGIIGSIELFLGLQTSMETELMASRNFYLLAIDIYKTLTLDRERRNCIGKEYLEEKYGEYTKLYGSAQIIRGKIDDKLTNIPGCDDLELSSNSSHDIEMPKIENPSISNRLSLQFNPNTPIDIDKQPTIKNNKQISKSTDKEVSLFVQSVFNKKPEITSTYEDETKQTISKSIDEEKVISFNTNENLSLDTIEEEENNDVK